MSDAKELLCSIKQGAYDRAFAHLYGGEAVAFQRERYAALTERFMEQFGICVDVRLFSAPGRVEVCGNHTDHNHGCVLAAGVQLDIIGVAAAIDEPVVHLCSQGYEPETILLGDLSPRAEEKNRTAALVRGMADRFVSLGHAIGGVAVCMSSNVPKGSGLSSSAAFEVLVGEIFNHLYNDGAIDAVTIAKAAQYAENVHFGKPSGLMDQMASAVGQVVFIDFNNPEQPQVQAVAADFDAAGYALCLVDAHDDHADLTHEYAAVPNEMRAVAQSLGVSVLRDTDEAAVLANMATLRAAHGDRAVLRALHFFRENARVQALLAALQARDFDTACALLTASGHSSFEYLQNIYAASRPTKQGLSLALALASEQLQAHGAWRVHGGGFGGTTLNIVPRAVMPAFVRTMEAAFGESCCVELRIRPVGGVMLSADND